jgi:lipoprotein-anchoring transpeptidase ErfK/SrfK
MTKTTRRSLILTGGAALFAPTVLRAQDFEADAQIPATGGGVRRNASSFRSQNWRDHFSTLGVATIVADTKSRALHFWDATGTDYRVFATSVPKTDELTRRGYTKIVRKREGPTWTPTANMRARDPSLPAFMEAGPDNPLGTHAMYLDWPAYLIHGTHDTRKIGRRSSSGCIGLYNEQIAELFSITPVGTQVRLV